MENTLDSVRMSSPASPAAEPRTKLDCHLIEDLRSAVMDFLKKVTDAREVNVTKLALMDSERGIWEAEAQVHVPNAAIRALGLPTQKEVLDCHEYLLRLDQQLNVVAYGLKESVG